MTIFLEKCPHACTPAQNEKRMKEEITKKYIRTPLGVHSWQEVSQRLCKVVEGQGRQEDVDVIWEVLLVAFNEVAEPIVGEG